VSQTDLIEAAFRSQERDVAPGVRGVVEDDGQTITIMWIRATTEGSGDVGRWLDSLPADRKVRVIGVTSYRLAQMLHRRGYRQVHVTMPSGTGWIEAHVRKPTPVEGAA
jgi:hypothetical protein